MPVVTDQYGNTVDTSNAAMSPAYEAALNQFLASGGGNTGGDEPAPATPATQFHAPTHDIILQNGNTGEKKTFKSGQYTATDIDQLTRNGWVPVSKSGKPMTTLDYAGGQMFFDPDTGEAAPLNVLMGDPLSPEQSAAMDQFKQTPQYKQTRQSWEYWRNQPGNNTQTPPSGNTPATIPNSPPASSAGNPLPSTGGTGNFTNNPNDVKLPDNWQGILKFMTTAGLNRSLQSNGLIDLATGQLSKANDRMSMTDQFVDSLIKSPDSGLEATGKWRNDVINQMLYGQPFTREDGTQATTPGVLDTQRKLMAAQDKPVEFDKNLSQVIGESADAARGFLSRANDAPGFSPEGKAALNQQLTRDIPGQFEGALGSAYAELQRRGALGGELPGSQADLSRVLAPIYAAKSAAYSKANTDSLMSEEQLKLQQLLSNRGLASNAINQLQGTGNLILQGDAQTIQQQQQNQKTSGEAAGSLQSLIATLGNIYDPNKIASNVIGGVNAGTGALEAANQSVNAATGAYSAGNQPFQTAAGSAESGTQTYDANSLKNLLLSSIFSTAAGGSGGAGSNIVDLLGKIFGGESTAAAGGTDSPSGNGFWSKLLNIGAKVAPIALAAL